MKHGMKYVTACVLLFTAVAAGGGCVRDFPEDDGKRITAYLAMHDEGAIARTRSGKPALIDPDGGLSIDGEAIPLDPAQRRLAKRYHDLTAALYADALAMDSTSDPSGGTDAVVSDETALTPLAAAADASAAEHSLPPQLCERISELRAAERALADAVPEFRPHVTLPIGIGMLCEWGTKR